MVAVVQLEMGSHAELVLHDGVGGAAVSGGQLPPVRLPRTLLQVLQTRESSVSELCCLVNSCQEFEAGSHERHLWK